VSSASQREKGISIGGLENTLAYAEYRELMVFPNGKIWPSDSLTFTSKLKKGEFSDAVVGQNIEKIARNSQVEIALSRP
jgi:hypothetical protein